jgi:heme exporter protein CcmD
MINGGFWSMGGYARYVWPSIGIACGVLAWNLWAAQRFLAAARLRAHRALAMESADAVSAAGARAAGDRA